MYQLHLTFLAGLGACVGMSGLLYLLYPEGDMILGALVYFLLFLVLVLGHFFGLLAAKLCTVYSQKVGSRQFLMPIASFLAIFGTNVAAFVLIVRAVLRYWIWDESLYLLIPSTVVGVIAASVFVYGFVLTSA
jgi:hypothetical protein